MRWRASRASCRDYSDLALAMTRKLTLLFLLFSIAPPCVIAGPAAEGDSPLETADPVLLGGYHYLYGQKFSDGRQLFEKWVTEHPREPFGHVSVAASYLFEELYRQNVLTSDFFLNNKRFLKGIEGKPDPERMKHFRSALQEARALAKDRLKKSANDPDALFSLAIADGMESDALSILEKKQLDGLKRMKEANENAKKLLHQRPDAVDAYVATGIANYIIGSLSGGTRFLLWFGGIHGDKQLGMEQVRKAAEGGRYLKPFGKIMLALAARREKQNALAQKMLRELTEEFPDSALFAAEYAKALGRPVPAVIRAK